MRSCAHRKLVDTLNQLQEGRRGKHTITKQRQVGLGAGQVGAPGWPVA